MLALVVALTVLAGAPPPKAAPKAEEVPAPPHPFEHVRTFEGAGELDDARKFAERYMRALSGQGDGRDLLLGGATLTAQDLTIEKWKIVKRDEVRTEEKPVSLAVKGMQALDRASAESLLAFGSGSDDIEANELTKEQADKLLRPTKEQAFKFASEVPLFAYVARVGHNVYFHPENPWRQEATKLGKDGTYKLEVHRFQIEEHQKGKPPRTWPLRVLRIKTKTYDSGYKILPASDWNPSY